MTQAYRSDDAPFDALVVGRAPREHLGQSLLDALAGREPPSPPELPSLAEAREHHRDDVVAARELALVHAHRATIADRVRAAVQGDAAPVLLDDGSRLTRDDAERVLATKEERRAFGPLRASLARAAEGGAARRRDAEARFRDVLGEVLSLPGDEVTDREQVRVTLERFVADLRDATLAAREALSREGRVPLEDPLSLARGLDVPDPAGFSADSLRRLGRALLEATGEHRQREVKALRVPRSLDGVVVSALAGAVRVPTCATVSAGRFLRLSTALGAGVALSLFEPRTLGPALEEQALLLGAALSLGSMSPVVRKGVFGETAREAERRARVLAATRVMTAHLWAEAALVLLAGEGRAAVRESLAGSLGTDPPPALLDELLTPPWPGLVSLRGPTAAVGTAALRQGVGAALAIALRDRYDEAFPLVPSPYELFGAAREALAAGDVGALALAGASLDDSHPGAALVAWASDLL